MKPTDKVTDQPQCNWVSELLSHVWKAPNIIHLRHIAVLLSFPLRCQQTFWWWWHSFTFSPNKEHLLLFLYFSFKVRLGGHFLSSELLQSCYAEAPGLSGGLDPGFPDVHIKSGKWKERRRPALAPSSCIWRKMCEGVLSPRGSALILCCFMSFMVLYLLRFCLCWRISCITLVFHNLNSSSTFFVSSTGPWGTLITKPRWYLFI